MLSKRSKDTPKLLFYLFRNQNRYRNCNFSLKLADQNKTKFLKVKTIEI